MRDFIDEILTFIGTATMTDGEYASVSIDSASYDQPTYEAILAMLNTRESISTFVDRLTAYFEAKGVVVVPPESTGSSNIFVGGDLS